MNRLIIKGKADLKGSIKIKPSKNSAIKIKDCAIQPEYVFKVIYLLYIKIAIQNRTRYYIFITALFIKFF